MDVTEAEATLTHYGETVKSRDQIVRDALASGVTVNRIYALTGIARSTLYRIRDAAEQEAQRENKRGRK